MATFLAAVLRLDPAAVELRKPGWPVPVEGGGAEMVIGLTAFVEPGNPALQRSVAALAAAAAAAAAVVVVVVVVAVAVEARNNFDVLMRHGTLHKVSHLWTTCTFSLKMSLHS